MIAIDRALDDEYFSCVISEDFGAAFELTRSVLTQDVHSVGLVGALPELNVSREREQGFAMAVKQRGLPTTLGYGEHFNREEGVKYLPNGWQMISYLMRWWQHPIRSLKAFLMFCLSSQN